MFEKWLQQNKVLSKKTITDYCYWVNMVFGEVDIWNKNEIENKLLMIKNTYKETSVKVIFSAVKAYIEFIKMELVIPKTPKTRYTEKYAICNEEVWNITNNYVSQNYYVSFRDKLIFEFLWKTGLRATELINLRIENVKGDMIVINGKGGKYRKIPVDHLLLSKIVEHSRGEYIFTKENGEKLSYELLYSTLEKVKLDLNLNNSITLHSFRRGFATELYKRGMQINMISRLLGHASITTTEIYIKYDVEDIREEMKKIGAY